MSAYLDASVLVAIFTNDEFSDRALAMLSSRETFAVSDFAAAEFASAIARQVRMRIIRANSARAVFATFDQWRAEKAVAVETTPSDIAVCAGFLRRLDLPLRTGDAFNIAIAHRLGATLMTFDIKMAESAQALGVAARSA